METSNEGANKNRAWYRTIDSSTTGAQSPVNVQFPKSKWDSEEEEEEGEIPDDIDSQEDSTVAEEIPAKVSLIQEECGKSILELFYLNNFSK